MARVFRIHERQNIELRGEAFNLPNFFLRGNPGTTFSNLATFGQVTTALNPRIMQFAIKYVF